MSDRAYAATLGAPLKHHHRLSKQIRGSALSVPANIAEGYALGTRAQFIRHLRIACGSAAELKCHLALADANHLLGDLGRELVRDSDRAIAMLIGLLRSLGARVPR